MAKFNIGDRIRLSVRPNALIFKVLKVDEITKPVPKYYIEREIDGIRIWDYCLGWGRVIEADDALRYGEVLTNDMVFGTPKSKSVLDMDWIRIRTISYDNRIFYHKMVNGEVVEFKELAT